MQFFTVKDCLECGGKLICGNENEIIENISTDSRVLDDNTLFIPIKGERFDGHDYVKSARMYISDREEVEVEGKCIIQVDNTLLFFGKLAKLYKEKYNLPTVSVVGSVGKTTTRDLTTAVLSQKYNTLKTDKNFNNNIGVPIMVFKIEKEHQICVLEMGMSALGEISCLADIIRPNTVIMTNIGMSHIENLGSQENIFKAKCEALENFTMKDTAIINLDDEFLKTVPSKFNIKTISYAVNNKEADYYAEEITDFGTEGTEFSVYQDGKKLKRIRLYIPGVHNVYNALAAFALGVHYDVCYDDIAKGLEGATLTGRRMEVHEIAEMKIINDSYNAAPDSVKAALYVLSSNADRRRVAVLGDILEMGDFAIDEHYKLGLFAKDKIDLLITVGENAKHIAEGFGIDNAIVFESTDEAKENILSLIKAGDVVLLKASNGMHFEKLFDKITEGNK